MITPTQPVVLTMPEWREIPLTKGLVALVDEGDYDAVRQFKWYAAVGLWQTYAQHALPRIKGQRRPRLIMHRFILQVPEGVVVDHVNGNGLDNRRANLRIASNSENAWNSTLSKRNKTGLKGVTLDHQRGGFRAAIRAGARQYTLGRFPTAEEAAAAYDAAALRLHGEFARTNAELRTSD